VLGKHESLYHFKISFHFISFLENKLILHLKKHRFKIVNDLRIYGFSYRQALKLCMFEDLRMPDFHLLKFADTLILKDSFRHFFNRGKLQQKHH
jgi:hypothetical protein